MAEKWNGENPKPKSLNPALGGNGLENCIELFSPSPFLSANAQFILRNMEMGKRAQMAHDSFRSLFNALYVSITLLQRIKSSHVTLILTKRVSNDIFRKAEFTVLTHEPN